jgi:hypothetical protein
VRPNNKNNLVEEEMDDEYVKDLEEIHLLKGGNNSMHLAQYDYEYSLNCEKHIPKSESNKECLSFFQYRMFVDAL